jgi:hypothetical protein
MATTTTKNVKKTEENTTNINWNPEWGKLEKVFVPTDDGDETPVTGCLNGMNWKIPRNQWVEVPEAIKDILDQSANILAESEKRNKKFEEGKLDLT